MDADRPGVVPPEDAVPPNVILQPFTDAPTQPGAVARAFRALAASVRAMLSRVRR